MVIHTDNKKAMQQAQARGRMAANAVKSVNKDIPVGAYNVREPGGRPSRRKKFKAGEISRAGAKILKVFEYPNGRKGLTTMLTIECTVCGAERTIHSQDAFQVYRCKDCQRKARNAHRAAWKRKIRAKARLGSELKSREGKRNGKG